MGKTSLAANKLIFLLAAIIATTPLAIDMYLPAIPQIAAELGSDLSHVQQSISIFLLGYAISQIIAGPLADLIGRRRLACIGLLGFSFASYALTMAENIESFLIFRSLQAFFGAFFSVVIPGVVQQIYNKNTAKGMSYLSLIMMIAPLLAPGIGSMLLQAYTWQAIFIFLGTYAMVMMILVICFLPNDPVQIKRRRKRDLLAGYRLIFSHRIARPFLISSMLSSFAFFCYITAIPFVYLDYYAVSVQDFPFYFAFNVSFVILANIINSQLSVRFGAVRMLRFGMFFGLIIGALLCLVTWYNLAFIYTVLLLGLMMSSLSFISTNSDALVLMNFKEHGGSAAASIGALRFGSGALAGPLLLVLHNDTPLAFTTLMLASLVVIILTRSKVLD
ncbi:MFS transporter, DHA1 family, bicyclomycin/chloramphenicol resistance protein [Colwellia chukchiensis]|uniref:Bcr/CflA family efflux transporter n=1 Tax=Colwellia chukchiensis TaxID=641665 RepID=A0A1H7NL01_9GAMM|nr:Bcr/CflA family efflux MFS transporter [Colwellia chukchiensis]SEL24064.1 MFS transporter, DHA1 family, bicyclomycin/chloramphenicol resistance protein [Colwellia chukchiensis]